MLIFHKNFNILINLVHKLRHLLNLHDFFWSGDYIKNTAYNLSNRTAHEAQLSITFNLILIFQILL